MAEATSHLPLRSQCTAWHAQPYLWSEWILTFEFDNETARCYLTKQLLSQGSINQPIPYTKAK